MKIDKESIIKQFVEEIRQENDGSTIEFMIPKLMANKVEGYRGIMDDLKFCKKIINECKTNESMSDILRQSCLYSIVVIYGKCFTDASTSKSPKLEESDIKDDKLLSVHNNIMDLRHNYVAHRGTSESIFNFIYLSLEVESYNPQIRGRQRKLVAFSPSDLLDLESLINYLLEKVRDKNAKASNKMFWGFMNEFKGKYGHFKIAGPEPK